MSKVYFVGCGPGDPDLITIKAKKLVQKADIIVYSGSLIPPEILKFNKKGKDDRSSNDLSTSRKNKQPALNNKWGPNSNTPNLRRHKTIAKSNDNFDFSYDYEKLQSAISRKTKAIFIAHLI
mgnify:CR=1 FL=1